MRKRLVSLVLAILLTGASASLPVLAAGSGSVAAQCSQTVVDAGGRVDIVVSADGIKSMAGYLIYIQCDTNVFQAVLDEEDGTVLVRKGDLTDSGTLMGNHYGTAGWQVLWFAPEDISGSGDLFTISLMIGAEAVSGEYEISIGYSPENTIDVEGNLCPIQTVGTMLQVVGKDQPEEDDTAVEDPSEPDSVGDGTETDVPSGEVGSDEKEPPVVLPVKDFIDVRAGHWAYPYIMTLAQSGIVSGAGDGRFYPERQVTRAEFVKMLAGIAKADVQGRSTTRFKDVNAGQWWTPYIAWASEEGIVNGISADRFGPDQLLTREQMATLIYRFCEKMKLSLPKVKEPIDFIDGESIASYAKQAVEAAQAAGIVNGYEDGTFRPKLNTKRSEAAKVLATVFALVNG